jgi:hypothetical protein
MATHRVMQLQQTTNLKPINCHHDNHGDPAVTPDSETLCISAGDQAEWISSEGRNFKVTFAHGKSPFSEETFHIPKGGSVISGSDHREGGQIQIFGGR